MDRQSVDATEDRLFTDLHDMYWKAATREICNMILSFNEIFQAPESVSDILKGDLKVEGQNFKKMFDLWTGAHSLSNKPQFDTRGLYTETWKRAKEHWITDQDNAHRQCARWILQSSSFLDIDIIYEPTPQMFLDEPENPSIEQVVVPAQEQSEESSGVILRGLFCSECTCLIRSPFSYECTEGCLWSLPPPYDILLEDGSIKETFSPSLAKTAWRLCSVCVAQDVDHGSCDREHLARMYHEIPAGKNVRRFQMKLSKGENSQRRGINRAKFADPIKVALHISEIRNELKQVTTPAGSFHVAFMLGPLIIESGLQEINHGVLISPRPLPYLCSDTRTASHLIQSLEEASSIPNQLQGIVLFKHKITKTRMLSNMTNIPHSRQILGTIKKVYGAAFSGYLEEDAGKEAAVVDALVSAAVSCTMNPSKTVKAYLLKLYRSAEKVVKCLATLLDNEIRIHLRRVVKRLLNPRTNLSWSLATNNCQRLVDVLLRGKDFRYIFPRLPKDFGSRDRHTEGQHFDWPRYLISFGDRLEGLRGTAKQSNSLVASFCQRKRNQCDLIDLIELLHQRSSTGGQDTVNDFASWQELRLALNRSRDADLRSTDQDNLIFEKLWELPRDTLSVIQFHLLRPSEKYRSDRGKVLSHLEWIDNRLRLLRQLSMFSALAGGFGAALLAIFHQKPYLLSKVQIPKSQVFGSLRADEKVNVIQSTPWNAAYLISNRLSPQESLFYDAKPSRFVKLDSLLKARYQNIAKRPRGSAAVEASVYIVNSLLDALLTRNRGVASFSQLGNLGITNMQSVTSLAISLVRQKMYGKEEWISMQIGKDTWLLIQNFMKSKTVR